MRSVFLPACAPSRFNRRMPSAMSDVSLAMDFVGNAQYLGEDLHVHCERADLMIRDGRLWIGRNGNVDELDQLEDESNPVAQFLNVLIDGAANAAPPECALPVFDLTSALLASGNGGGVVDCGCG